MAAQYRKNQGIIYREEGEGAFLFDPENGNLKYLNQSAREIFLMLDDLPESEKILRRLQESYPDADQDRLKGDLSAFLDQLADHKFISSIDNSGSRLDER